MKSYTSVRIVIVNSSSPEKVIPSPSEELMSLKVGSQIEIEFKDQGNLGEFEVIERKEEWSMNVDGDDITWIVYKVKYISGTTKMLNDDL